MPEAGVLIFVIAIFVACGLASVLMILGRLLNKRELPPRCADAALVFGTGKEWKARSRCATAAELVKGGFVRETIVSGGVQVKDLGMTEAEWFRKLLIEKGVRKELINVENRATNTKENVDHALEIIKARGFSSVVLVMSDFEGLRAHLTASKSWSGTGVRIYNWHAPSPGHWSASWWWLTSEGRSLTWYAASRIYRYKLLRNGSG